MTLTFKSYLAKATPSGEFDNNKLGNFSVVNTFNPAIAKILCRSRRDYFVVLSGGGRGRGLLGLIFARNARTPYSIIDFFVVVAR